MVDADIMDIGIQDGIDDIKLMLATTVCSLGPQYHTQATRLCLKEKHLYRLSSKC